MLNARSFADAVAGERELWVPGPEIAEHIEPGSTSVKVLALDLDEGMADPWDADDIWIVVDELGPDSIIGTVTESPFGEMGFRVGDTCTVPIDRIVDWVRFAPDGRPLMNEERMRAAVGKRVIVGQTHLSSDGDVSALKQFAGIVAGFDDTEIRLLLDSGEVVTLPPDSRALRDARPGEYRLSETGEVVANPSFLATWTISGTGG